MKPYKSRHDYEQELAALHTYLLPTEAGYIRKKPTQLSAEQTKSSYCMPKTKRGLRLYRLDYVAACRIASIFRLKL